MSKYSKIINIIVNLYQKSIWFAFLFCLISIGITGLLSYIPITIIRVISMATWWGFSFSIMIESLMQYTHKK